MAVHCSGFRRQRLLVFSAMFIGWLLYNFCYKIFTASMSDLMRHRNLDKTDLGAIASIFNISYGISKLVIDITLGNLSGKLLLSLGLVSSGVCCVLFPRSSNVLVLAVLWGLHGCVQALGWPGCANLLKSWYGHNEIATWWSILTASGNIGGIATPLFVANLAFYWGWESAFCFVGTVAGITAVLLWLLIKDSPSQSINPSLSIINPASRRVKNHSCTQVVFNLDVWVICISCIIFTVLRYCISDWSQLYFIEAADLTEAKSNLLIISKTRAVACVSMYQAGAVVGIILIGYLSDLLIRKDGDRQYKHPRALVIFLNTLLIIGILHMYGNTVLPGVSKVVLSCLQFCAGGLIEGGTNLIGVAVMDCVSPELRRVNFPCTIGKLLLSVGLFISGVCCLLFPCFDRVLVLAALWGCNGYVQGFGWPGCANILKNWYARGEIATWWSILSAAGNVGATITPLAFTYIALNFGWENAFYLTGMVACFAGVLLWILIRDSPHVNASTDKGNTATENSHSWYEVLVEFDLWVVAFGCAMLGMIRYCISDWSLLYFTEATRLTEARAAFCVSMYQVGGVVGTILIGYLSDKFLKQDRGKNFEHARAPALFLVSILLTIVLRLLNSAVKPRVSEVVLSGLLFCAGAVIEGSTSLLGVTAMDCVVPQLSGSSGAVATFVSQLGAFFAGLPFGYLIKKFGWAKAFFVLEFVSAIYIVSISYLLIKYYNSYMTITSKKQK